MAPSKTKTDAPPSWCYWIAALVVLPLASYPILGPALQMFNKTFLMNPVDTYLYQQKAQYGLASNLEGRYRRRRVLLVGGTAGVGYGTALAMARAGASRLTLVGRNVTAGRAAVDALYERCGEICEESLIEFVQGDIGTVASTRRLLERLKELIVPETMEEEEDEEASMEETIEEEEEEEEIASDETEDDGTEDGEETTDETVDENNGGETEEEYDDGEDSQDEAEQEEEEEETAANYYDILVVSAGVFPNLNKNAEAAINQDGIEQSFATAVVGRFLLYFNAPLFLHPRRGRILNVLGAGADLGPFWPELVHQTSQAPFGLSLPLHMATFAHGNEMMMRRVLKERADFFHNKAMVSVHPGILDTDLHRGGGWWLLELLQPIVAHIYGTTVEISGRRQASTIIATLSDKTYLHTGKLTLIDNFGVPRLPSATLKSATQEHGDWLWELLMQLQVKMEQQGV